MKILYYAIVELDLPGGPTVHTLNIVKGFQRIGVDCRLAAPKPSKQPSCIPESGYYWFKFYGFRFGKLLLCQIMHFVHLLRKIKAFNPDVILVRDHEHLFVPFLLVRILNKPVILEMNGPLVMDSVAWGEFCLDGRERHNLILNFIQKLWRKLWRNFVLNRTHAVITNTHHLMKKMAAEFNLDKERQEVLTMHVDFDRFPVLDRKASRLNLGIHPESLVIGYLGSFQPSHDLQSMVALMEAVESQGQAVELVFIGGGPDAETFRHKLQNHRLFNKMHFLGWVPQMEIAQALSACDFGWNVMRAERSYIVESTMKFKEYLACGLIPIVNAGQKQDWIESPEDVLAAYEEGKIHELARRVCHLKKNWPVERIREAIEYLKTHYGIEQAAVRILGLYQKIGKKAGPVKQSFVNLRNKTVASMSAVTFLQATKKMMTFMVSVLLYRCLSSQDYGVFALCENVLMLAMLFSDFGIEDAVIQNQDYPAARVIQAGWILKFCFTSVIFLCLLTWSHPIAAILRQPVIASPLRWIILTLLANMIIFKAEIQIKKELNFSKFVVPELLAQMAASLLALYMAWQGFGVWSLVASVIVGQGLRIILLLFVQGGEIYWNWDAPVIRSLLVRSKYAFWIALLYIILSNFTHFFIAQWFTLKEVGYFYLAFNWGNFCVIYLIQPLGKVVFPAVAAISSDKVRVLGAYKEYLHRVAFIAVAFGMALMASAPYLIPCVAGSQWTPAIRLCQILCFHGILRSMASVVQIMMNGVGMFRTSAVYLTIEVCCFFACTMFFKSWWLLEGIAWALVVSKAIGLSMSLTLFHRRMRGGTKDAVMILGKYLFSGACMAAAMKGVGVQLSGFGLNVFLILLFQLLVGGLIFLISYYLVHGKQLMQLRSLRKDFEQLIVKGI